MPVAFVAATLLRPRPILRSAIPALVPALVCVVAYLWAYLAGMTEVPVERLVVQSLPDVQKLIRVVISNILSTVIHLGLFLLPMFLIGVRNAWRLQPVRVITTGAVSTLVMALMIFVRLQCGDEILLPFFGSWLAEWGVGPALLSDSFILRLRNMQPLPKGFWVAVTAVGFVGAILLITTFTLIARQVVSMIKSRRLLSDSEFAGIFGFLTSVLYFLLLLPTPAFFDKYVIPMIIFLAIAIVSLTAEPAALTTGAALRLRLASYALIVSFGVFAVVGTRDFLTWNRVRWTALRELMLDSQVRPEFIAKATFSGCRWCPRRCRHGMSERRGAASLVQSLHLGRQGGEER